MTEQHNAIKKDIILFDDSKDVFAEFYNYFKEYNINVRHLKSTEMDEVTILRIKDISPQIFIVDLIMGEDRSFTISLIEKLNENFSETPIIIYSKIIYNTGKGLDEKERWLNLSGVKYAFSKIIDEEKVNMFNTILQIIRRGNNG